MGSTSAKEEAYRDVDTDNDDSDDTTSTASTISHPGDSGTNVQATERCMPVAAMTHMCSGMSRCTAKPQILHGREVWPIHWGLSRDQLAELLARLRHDVRWRSENDVYTLVRDFVIPWTAGTGVGYALLVNSEEPREVNVMVSHAFQENAEDFLEAVLRRTDDLDVIYICALANYQVEDKAGPSIVEQLGTHPKDSPFRQVLEHIHACCLLAGWRSRYRAFLFNLSTSLFLSAQATILIESLLPGSRQTMYESPWGRHWQPIITAPIGLCVLATVLRWWVQSWPTGSRGRMIVVPNHNCDIYSRLWCVYEIYIADSLGVPIKVTPSFAPAGKVCACEARCSVPQDQLRIQAEIVQTSSYAHVDAVISHTIHGTGRFYTYLGINYFLMIPLSDIAYDLAEYPGLTPSTACIRILEFLFLHLCALVLAYYTARWTQGVIRANNKLVWACFCVQCSFTTIILYSGAFDMWSRHKWLLWPCMILGDVAAGSLVVLILVAARTQSRQHELDAYSAPVATVLVILGGISQTIYSRVCDCQAVEDDDMYLLFSFLLNCLLIWTWVGRLYFLWSSALRMGIKVTQTGSRSWTTLAWLSTFVWMCGWLVPCWSG